MLCTPGSRPSKAGRQQEAPRMGESNSPREKVKLSKAAALGCYNRRVQGTFLWVPSWVRSSVDPPMAILMLSSGAEELCTGLSNAKGFVKHIQK